MKTKIATSIDQSKKLIALGLDPETADMYWLYVTLEGYKGRQNPLNYKCEVKDFMYYEYSKNDVIPAWSLSALLELMPVSIKLEGNNWCGHCKLIKDYGAYGCIYPSENDEGSPCTVTDTPLDAAYEMICWLLEMKYIKGGKV